MNKYCAKCFNDYAIKKYIKDNGKRGYCSYCHKRGSILPANELGSYIRECFHKAYESLEESGIGWIRDDDFTREIPAIDFLVDEVGADDDSIVQDLIDSSAPDQSDIMDGDYDELDGGLAFYLLRDEYYGSDENRFASAWKYFKLLVKHKLRFFDLAGQEKREEILKPLVKHILKLEKKIPSGTVFFRARLLKNRSLPSSAIDIQKQIGPPPNRSSSHSRMSPAGIPYFYLSSDIKTCIAEINPNVGEKIVIGSFATSKKLKVLDLSSVPDIKIPSIFDPLYDHSLRWATDFARDFITELSLPYNKHDNLIDYIPTQVLSEFIRSRGYDGIKFNSSQNPDGVNYTFFCGPKKEILDDYSRVGITEFTEWFYLKKLEIKSVNGISIHYSSNGPSKTFKRKDVCPPEPPNPF